MNVEAHKSRYKNHLSLLTQHKYLFLLQSNFMKVPAAFIIDKVVGEACIVKYFLNGLICKMLLAVKTAGHSHSQNQQYELTKILFCLM